MNSKIVLALILVFALLGAGIVYSHHTDVHGSATDNISEKACTVSNTELTSTDITMIKQGSVDEDDWDILPRYRNHHYNPHTEKGKPPGGPALQTAGERWGEMLTAFTYPDRRWLGDENDGLQGSMHCLGRVLHLLQDMASPPHTHAPDGHGWSLVPGPGGNPLGFYSDFEETWSPGRSRYKNWPFPSVSGGPLTPVSAAIPWANRASWNSELDEDSWGWMTSELNGIPVAERDEIEGYIKAQAWISYFHTSFYGQINWNESNPAPATTSSGRTNILRRMFPGRISFTNGMFDDYWTIDGVGYYDKKLQYFTEDWWPCPWIYPYGSKTEGSGANRRILGRFYIYLHYYRVETSGGGTIGTFYRAIPPDKWPDGTSNNGTPLARYYGDVLLPLSVRFCSGLLREAFPAPASITYPNSSTTGQYTVSWEAAPESVAGSARVYVLQRSDDSGGTWTNVYESSGRSYNESRGSGSYRYRVIASFGSGYSPRLYGGWCTGTYDCSVSLLLPPTVETRSATLVGKTAAMLNGRIVDDGGSSIIERRFDWGITPSGDGWTDWTRDVSVSGQYFSYYLIGLNPGTIYYFRAWATNRDPGDPSGWGQGSILSFTTTSPTQFTITASAGANGSISPSGTIVKNAGESQQFTAFPNTNYAVNQWYLDGSSVQTSGTSYTLSNIQSDHTVYVTFRYVPPKYTITASAGANGSISPSGTIVKNAGENQQFIAMPNTGYTVDTWHLDGSADQTGGTTYTLNNIQSDYSVHVTFKSVPPEYTITASAGANGSISPSGTIEKNAGESQQFTATPNANYAVDQWYLNGSSVQTGGSSYTLTDIQSDHTIYVTFKTIPPTTIYVDDDASHDPGPGDPSVSDPLENGSTEHPYDSIQEAIDVASNGDTIIVLDGTYRGSSNRDIDFSGKAITVRSQNGSENCIIDCQGTVSEPHRGFKFHSGEGSSSVIDGLTITNGYGPFEDYGSVASSLGGGICCLESSPTIANCIITNNTVSSYNCYGAGIFGRNSSLIVTNCVILNNSTNGTYCYGGGIYLHGGSARIINSAIMGNAALGVRGGGGIYSAHYDSTTIIGCLVTGNSAGTGGGIHFQSRSNGIISNCTIANNSAGVGNGITYGYIWGLTTTNSILWDGGNEIYPQGVQLATPVATFCNVQGGTPGEGNIDMDPLFVDASNPDPDECDYHLMANSPCINAGDPGYSPDPGETDFDGNPRIVDNRIDIGAYEFQGIIGDFCGEGSDQPDGYVDYWDLLYFAQRWHSSPSDTNWDSRCDLDKEDNYVDYWDLLVFAQNWHEGEPP